MKKKNPKSQNPKPKGGKQIKVLADSLLPPKMVNQNQLDSQKRQEIARRRAQVASLYHARQTQEEIADRLGVSQPTVSEDLRVLRERWNAQSTETIGEWIAAETAFAVDMRTSALKEWQAGHDARAMQLVIRWTERLAKLLGLDAPDKLEDWTERDWREYAKANGLSEAEVIAEAERIIAESQGGGVAVDAGGEADG